VQVYDPTGTNKSFRSGIVTGDGATWLVTLPGDATIPSNQPSQIVVQPLVNGLAAGTYQGTVTLQFSDGTVSKVAVRFIVGTGTMSGGRVRANETRLERRDSVSVACTQQQLLPSLLTLGSGFSVPAGYPQGLEAQVVDNCGIPQVDGTVFVQFDNGDAPVKMRSLGNGMWDGTWPVRTQAALVTLTVIAQNATAVQGSSTINGALEATIPQPMVNSSNGVQNSASLTLAAPGAPVAPGEFISIFGQQLSGGQSPAGAGSLPTALAGTTVLIGSQTGSANGQFQALPLQFASGGQVNALVPYGTSTNTNQQILLQWGTAYAPAVYVDVAAAQPGIFQYGNQQGIITDAKGNLIGPMNPAHAGDAVVIYCTGLGVVSPAVADGAVTPISPLSMVQNDVTVTIGGLPAGVLFAGLAPTGIGLYQINVSVPSGISPGDQIPVNLTVDQQPGPVVFTSVK
jgi:uncharacterized protein (TIGR03437 family)